jgi:hypothetical protein
METILDHATPLPRDATSFNQEGAGRRGRLAAAVFNRAGCRSVLQRQVQSPLGTVVLVLREALC